MFYNRAIDLIEAGNLSRGVEMLYLARELAEVNQMHPDAPNIRNVSDVLGLCLFAQGKFPLAKDCFEHSEKYQKTMESPEFLQYAEAYNDCLQAVEEGKHLKGLLKFLPVLKSLPNVEGYNLAGLLFYQLGMKKSALAFWRKSLNIDMADRNAAYYIAHSSEGRLPLTFEKILWGVSCIAGELKLL